MAVFFTRRAKPQGVNYVEYIESTGTQWLNTEYVIRSEKHRIVCDVMFTAEHNSQSICGSQETTNWRGTIIPHCTNGTNVAIFCGGSFPITIEASLNTPYHIDITADNGTMTAVINGETYSGSYSTPTVNGFPVFVFANNQGGTATQIINGLQMSDFQLYDNDVLVRDYWPCYDPDGVLCMYDRVNFEYVYNAGTGEFLPPSAEEEPSIEVGTVYVLTEDGDWTCEADGNYSIELHGGGGGGSGATNHAVNIGTSFVLYYVGGAGGGGSGELYEKTFAKGTVVAVKIGAGGAAGASNALGSSGGATTFGDLSVSGGGVASAILGGYGGAVGSLATNGTEGNVYAGGYADGGAGGYGNKNNTAQTYGNGGAGGDNRNGTLYAGSAGRPGAVIITYLGA